MCIRDRTYAVTTLRQASLQELADRTFSVGSCHMDDIQLFLRIAQLFHQCLHAFKSQDTAKFIEFVYFFYDICHFTLDVYKRQAYTVVRILYILIHLVYLGFLDLYVKTSQCIDSIRDGFPVDDDDFFYIEIQILIEGIENLRWPAIII